jgi:UDP-N-acetylmuramoylalanine--D-glutamate ligase
MQAPDPMDLSGRRVLVVGAARTGLAVARVLARHRARVRLVDRRLRPEEAAAAAALGPEVECRLGDDGPATLAGVDLVVPSPGVSASAPVLAEAVTRGIPVRSEIELAAALVSCPLLAVTGTNGKSTTTTLVGEMLAAAGRRVFVGGNLGTPLAAAVDHDWDVAVVEISSFQLEWVAGFRPAVAVLLNVTPDHLDRHGSMAAYLDAKTRIFAAQGVADRAVLNRDDPAVWGLRDRLRSRVVSFGVAAHPGAGACVRGDRVVVRDERGAEVDFPLAAARLTGRHNLENMMASVLVARDQDVSPAAILSVLRRFGGLPHRCELVAESGGVRYYDDSKATNVGAVIKSLEGFREPLVLVMGGVDKDTPFEPLRPHVRANVRRVVAYGKAAVRIAGALEGAVPVARIERFADAVRAALADVRPGEIVLLAPGCASFDQFTGYAERGDAFRALVGEITGGRGRAADGAVEAEP